MSDYLESLFSVSGKTALVTGGATGIGRMAAEALVRAGANVMICSRKGDACEAVAKELNDLGASGTAFGFAGDLATEEGNASVVEQVRNRTDKLDILMNNSGISWGSTYDEFPRSAWDKVMNVNITAIFELTRALTDLLEAAATTEHPARVVNTASVMGVIPLAGGAYSYAVSKAGVIHLTKILAQEFTGRRITVNAFAPGPFPSRMTAFATASEAGARETARRNPLGRMGEPRDIAAATLYLCGPGGGYITGSTLNIDGGTSVQVGGSNLFADME